MCAIALNSRISRMKTLAHSLDEMLPESYRDGSFDLVVRDAHSVAIYWDLAKTAEPPHEGSRLCLRYTNAAGETDTLILHHKAGHVLVPLPGEGRWYKFTLGWLDAEKFLRIASVNAELPPDRDAPKKASAKAAPKAAHHAPSSANFNYRGSIFLPLSMPVERRGFTPPPSY